MSRIHPHVSATLIYAYDCMTAVLEAETPQEELAARLRYERAERAVRDARADAGRETRLAKILARRERAA